MFRFYGSHLLKSTVLIITHTHLEHTASTAIQVHLLNNSFINNKLASKVKDKAKCQAVIRVLLLYNGEPARFN